MAFGHPPQSLSHPHPWPELGHTTTGSGCWLVLRLHLPTCHRHLQSVFPGRQKDLEPTLDHPAPYLEQEIMWFHVACGKCRSYVSPCPPASPSPDAPPFVTSHSPSLSLCVFRPCLYQCVDNTVVRVLCSTGVFKFSTPLPSHLSYPYLHPRIISVNNLLSLSLLHRVNQPPHPPGPHTSFKEWNHIVFLLFSLPIPDTPQGHGRGANSCSSGAMCASAAGTV